VFIAEESDPSMPSFTHSVQQRSNGERTLFVLLTAGKDATDVIPAGFWPESSVFEADKRRKKLDSGPEALPE
jgi:hypothetical protein